MVQCPKMMAPLVKEWIPQAFTVSFKVQKHFSKTLLVYFNILFEKLIQFFQVSSGFRLENLKTKQIAKRDKPCHTSKYF